MLDPFQWISVSGITFIDIWGDPIGVKARAKATWTPVCEVSFVIFDPGDTMGNDDGDRWIPRTKGQLRGKCVHLMKSSCCIFRKLPKYTDMKQNLFWTAGEYKKWLTYEKTSQLQYTFLSLPLKDQSRTPFSKSRRLWINSLWPNDAVWCHKSGPALAQVTACGLTAPRHCLNQCWHSVTFTWEQFLKKCSWT